MALTKQTVTLNFSQGLDQKSDPFQIPLGKFSQLTNSVFNKLGGLTKRNGFSQVTSLPDNSSTFVTTFNGDLTAIGRDLKALVADDTFWVSKGQIDPLSLSTLSLIKNSTNQTYVDTAISPNGLICVTYIDSVTVASTTLSIPKYAVVDQTTGQNVVQPTKLVSTFGTVSYNPKVFTFGSYFVLAYATVGSGTIYHLQYSYINAYSPAVISSSTDFSTSYTPSSQGSFDGAVGGGRLFLSWNGAGNSGLQSGYITSVTSAVVTASIASTAATIVSVVSDTTSSPTIWTTAFFNGSSSAYSVATDISLSTLFSATNTLSSGSGFITNVTSYPLNSILNILYETQNFYSYDTSIATNYIQKQTINMSGSQSGLTTLVRSVGLASEPFLIASQPYFLSTYQSPNQSTYFLINSSGGVSAKLAYGNGNGYLTQGLPSVYTLGSQASVGYLVKDLVQSANKATNVSSTTQVAGIYTQTGINLVNFNFTSKNITPIEAGSALQMNGGFLWMYDGTQVVEHGFHLYPSSVELSQNTTTTGSGTAHTFISVGSLSAQNYFYQATYEWGDNQGNQHRSGPSIPTQITVVSSATNALFGAVTIKVPTLRLTYKTQSSPKIVIYRWSTAQQTYYQVTSITQPILNDPTIDSISFTDTLNDTAILGNNILYTNGGVVENIELPSSNSLTLFDSRLWQVNAEDPNQTAYSKNLVENVPVETSDLFTVFISPNAAAQGPTGPITAQAPMDDKIILFKKNAIYFVNGTGPDTTGANSQFSQPIFISGTVGCSNQKSIVLMPNGLMFQSDKGIWLLGRDLSTTYIGAPVENFNQNTVVSAIVVPGTNQVRFTLNNNVTLMYDYFFNQWGTFSGIPGISSTLYEDLHTYITSAGQVFQESPGSYLDGSSPTLMSFTTGWINLAGIQGYQRAYWMTLLGTFYTPHKLILGIAYDYDPTVLQQTIINPTNYSAPWGVSSTWGNSALWGGSTNVEQWQVNFQRQQCQAIQISFQEQYDPTFGAMAGQGLTLSTIELTVGLKKGYPRDLPSTHRTG